MATETPKLSQQERDTWVSSDERSMLRGMVETNKWLEILGGYNALMTFRFQWAKMAEQAGEDEVSFRQSYLDAWSNAAHFAAKSCIPGTIPKEWREAWKLLR